MKTKTLEELTVEEKKAEKTVGKLYDKIVSRLAGAVDNEKTYNDLCTLINRQIEKIRTEGYDLESAHRLRQYVISHIPEYYKLATGRASHTTIPAVITVAVPLLVGFITYEIITPHSIGTTLQNSGLAFAVCTLLYCAGAFSERESPVYRQKFESLVKGATAELLGKKPATEDTVTPSRAIFDSLRDHLARKQ